MDEQEHRRQVLGEFPPDEIYRSMKAAYGRLQHKCKDRHDLNLAHTYIYQAMQSIQRGGRSGECLTGLLEGMGELIQHLNRQLLDAHSVRIAPIMMAKYEPPPKKNWYDGIKKFFTMRPNIGRNRLQKE